MKNKIFTGVVAIVLSALTATAHAYPAWAISSKGIIAEGKECVGLPSTCTSLFGLPGQDLTGQAYSLEVTASVDPALYEWWRNENRLDNYGTGYRFFTTITVNGHTVTYNSWHPITTLQTMSDGYGRSYNVGRTAIDEYVTAGAGRFGEQFGASFELIAEDSHTWFYGTHLGGTGLRITQIPEPSSIALFGVGVFAFCRTRRRLTHKCRN